MGIVRVRYFVQLKRGQKIYHYWQPSAELREFGWTMQRLSDDLSEAVQQAERINADVDRWYAGGKTAAGPREGSVSDLIKRYSSSEAFDSLAEKTRREYTKHLKLIEDTWGDLSVSSITRPAILAFKGQYRDRPHQGNAILRTMRIVFGYAIDLGWTQQNPAANPRQFKVRPRDQVWTLDQERTFVDKTHELGMPSMALGFALGVYTAQREADIIRMPWSAYDGEWINGIRQRKTDKRLDIPVLSPLRAALEAAPRHGTIMLLTERGRSYRTDHFQHQFHKVTVACGLDGLQFRDLRRTAIVRMGAAGLELNQIAQITGHSYERTSQILETYMPRRREIAAEAARRMEAYYADLYKPERP